MSVRYSHIPDRAKRKDFLALVMAGLLPNFSVVRKDGYNADVDAAVDLVEQDTTYAGFPASGNAETLTVVSSDAADAAAGTGARTLTIKGLDSDWEEVTTTVTLNGTTPVATTQTFRRVNEVTVATAGSGGVNAGAITITHTTTTTNIFAVITAGANKAQTATYTVPANKWAAIVSAKATVNHATTIARLCVAARENGKAFVNYAMGFASQAAPYKVDDEYALTFPEKTDIKLSVLSVSAANLPVDGSLTLLVFPE